MTNNAPIGIFDSGLGGLSVAREIRALLPDESLVYLADSAHCPYGGRSLDEIRALSTAATRELLRRGAKLVVVACNTASGAGIEALRASFDVPIVGVEPAVKPAAALSRNHRIGVMATAATLATERFERLTRNYARDVQVLTQPCPGLVELVEAGETTGDRVSRTLQPLLAPLRDAEIDTLVLGCTHYPFLRAAIEEIMGPEVWIVESGPAVARQVKRVLEETSGAGEDRDGVLRLLTTGDPGDVRAAVEKLWSGETEVEGLAEDYGSGQLRSSGARPSAVRTR